MLPYTSGDLHVGHWYAMAPSDAAARYRRMRGKTRVLPYRIRRLRAAGGERGDQARHPPPEVDVRQRRPHARPAQGNGRDVRLVARGDHGGPEVLPLEPVVLHQDVREGAGLPEEGAGELVPFLPDGPGERAGAAGRDLRALRHARSFSATWSSGSSVSATTRRSCWTSSHMDWPDRITTMQRNWIGRSEGLEIDFGLDVPGVEEKAIRVFTTRPDTVFGVTFDGAGAGAPAGTADHHARPQGGSGCVHRPGGAPDGDRAAEHGAGEDGRLHRRLLHQPAVRRTGADLDRGLRAGLVRHGRRDGRARARPAGLRVRAEARPAVPGRHRSAGLGRRASWRRRTRSPARW